MWLSALTNPTARHFLVPPIVLLCRGPVRPRPRRRLATEFSSINMPTTIDLASLRYTILAADHRSFRAAALTLGVRSSVISRRIRDLEDTIGVSIFERFSGGIRLTDAGAEFVAAIRRALDDIDAAISTAGTAGLGGSGRLKIGFCGSLSTGELRATLIDYLGRYPDVAVDVTEGCGPQLTTELKRQAIDIAILADESPRDEDTMALWSERVMVAVPDSHCLATRSQVHWYDLMGERILLSRRDDGPEIHSLLIACLSAPGERPVIESHKISRENVLSMVGAGRGVALLHQGGTGITYPGVVYREVHGADGPVEVANVACWASTNDNPALRRFLSLLKERYPAVAASRVTDR
jgi:DNA-binding transcriptional LysR family regulator